MNKAAGWVYYYNLERRHYGEGMDGELTCWVLRNLGYDLPREFALYPPLVLDRISAHWALRGCNDLLARYKVCPGQPAGRGGCWELMGQDRGPYSSPAVALFASQADA